MDDLDDIAEAVVDVEDIAEEVFEPDELLEDFEANPLGILLALAAAGAALFTLLMLAVLVVLVAFQFGFLPIAIALFVFGLLATLLALGGFLYIRSGVPHRVERKINRKRAEVDDREDERTAMTEEEAIDELRNQYATGELTEEELKEALEVVITSDDPERAVREYDSEEEHEREYEREYDH
jgi:hypothetical protein